jgi:hypothetical protein
MTERRDPPWPLRIPDLPRRREEAKRLADIQGMKAHGLLVGYVVRGLDSDARRLDDFHRSMIRAGISTSAPTASLWFRPSRTQRNPEDVLRSLWEKTARAGTVQSRRYVSPRLRCCSSRKSSSRWAAMAGP